jgi:hypothetical protein
MSESKRLKSPFFRADHSCEKLSLIHSGDDEHGSDACTAIASRRYSTRVGSSATGSASTTTADLISRWGRERRLRLSNWQYDLRRNRRVITGAAG